MIRTAIAPTRARGAPIGVGSVSTQLRTAGVLLFILGAQFMTVIMLAASIAPDYDLSRGAISDLGVVRETALLFNASLLGVGVLNVAAGLMLQRATGRTSILAIFTIAGIGAAGAGLVPLDRGELHGLFALVAFLFFNLGAIVAAAVAKGPMRVVSWVAGLAGIAFVALMAIGDAGNPAVFGAIGHGGAERMIVYPPMLWTVAFGGYLMAAPRGTPAKEAP